MSTTPNGDNVNNEVYWPRVKEILDGIMDRWKERWDQLAECVLSGVRAIEPGVPGRETALVRSLARSILTFGRMPLRGPFLPQEELDEIAAWIDAGMPEGPPEA